MTTSSDPTRSRPIRLPRIAEIVAARLRLRIVRGDLQDGDVLPRESDLRDEFGVSRPSLREAIRILETERLIRIRRGKLGGAVVSRPSAESAAYHLGLSLQARATTLGDVAAARAVLEPVCAGLVAGLPPGERADAVGVLCAVVDESAGYIGEPYLFTDVALRFHMAVTDLCRNTTIALLTSALESVWTAHGELSVDQSVGGPDDLPLAAVHEEVLRSHRAVVGAIASGEAGVASEAMRCHVERSRTAVGGDGAEVGSTPA